MSRNILLKRPWNMPRSCKILDPSLLVTEISQAYTAWRYGSEAQQIDRLQDLFN